MTKGRELWDLSEVPAENQDWLQSGRRDSQQLPQVLGAGEGGGAGQRVSPVEVALPFASVARPLCVHPAGDGGGGGPRVFSFIYCLLFLQIRASAAPSGIRGFTLKVSSCVSLFSASFRAPSPRSPFVSIFGSPSRLLISVHLSRTGFSRESGVWSVGPLGRWS